MKAEPRLGAPSHAQGYAPPPVEFDDRAKVYRTDQQTCTPVDCYQNVLVTEEFNPSEPGAFQLKYYAPSVGNVRVGWRGEKEEEKETLELVELNHLSPETLAKVRREAMEMDRRAYERSEVYRETPPTEHTLRVEDSAGGSASATSATANASSTAAATAQYAQYATATSTALPPTGGPPLAVPSFALVGGLAVVGFGLAALMLLRRRS